MGSYGSGAFDRCIAAFCCPVSPTMPSPQPVDSVLYSGINSVSKNDDDSVFVCVFVPFLFFFPFLFSFFFFCDVVVVFSSLPLSSSDLFAFLFVLAKSFERALGTALLKPSLPLLLVRPFESILEDDDDDGDASGSRIAFGILTSSRHRSRRRRRRLKDDDDDDGVVVIVIIAVAL